MVEWKKLGDVCTFNRGRTITAKNAVEGSIPVIAGGQTPSYYHNEANRTGESITVAGSGAYAGFVAYWNQPIFVSDAFTVDPLENLLHKYVYHFLKKNQQRVFETQKGAGVPHVHGKDIAGFIIPVPSLSEQQRIVGILDMFTASIENLKEQIALRRKQYEYYRDQLLDLEGKEGVEMKTLGDTCVIKNGYTPSTKNADFWENGTIPWFTLEDIRKNGRILTDAIKHITPLGVKSGGLFPSNSIIVSTTATIGEYALTKTDFLCNQQITCLSIKDNFKEQLSPKFLYYLSAGIGKWCKKNVNGGGSLQIVSTNKLKSLSIPVPSIHEQSRIVSILDTFEASIANLEAQLKLREKQYEYYRNKLLTFE